MSSDARLFLSRLQANCSSFLSWWFRELKEIADALLIAILPRLVTRAAIALRSDGGGSLWLLRGRKRELLLTFSTTPDGAWPESLDLDPTTIPRGTRTVLALDPQHVLVNNLTLPESVERNLDEVVALQLERESPIPPDRACCDKSVIRRLKTERHIQVQLLIAHRHRIEQARRLVAGWGLNVVRVGVGTTPEDVIGNFLRPRTHTPRLELTPIERRLAVSAVTLGIVWLGVVGVHWGYERARVGHELERLAAPAAAATRLAHDIQARAAPGEALVSLMSRPDASDALTHLTSEIPKDTWVYELEVTAQWPQQPRLKLSGFAPVATMLIGHLENSGQFQRVRLVSALSAGLGSGQDRVQITAQLAAPRTNSLDHDDSTANTSAHRSLSTTTRSEELP